MIRARAEEISDCPQVPLGLIGSSQVDARGVNEPLLEQVEGGVARPLEYDQPDVSLSRQLLGNQADGRVAACDDQGLRRRSPRVVAKGAVLERPIMGQQAQRRKFNRIST